MPGPGVGQGQPPVGSIILTPAYGVWGPNFIVREANGYLSREEILLKHAPGAGIFPEGLVLMVDAGGGPGGVDVWVPFDGVGEAAGILYQMKNAEEGETSATAVVRVAEVQRAMLKFAGTLSDAQKEAAFASLAAQHITLR